MNENQVFFNFVWDQAKIRLHPAMLDMILSPTSGVNLELANAIKFAFTNANDSKQEQDFREIFQAQMQEIAWRFHLKVPQ